MSQAEFAGVRETHAGVVFLFGDRAYKAKKPVDLGFLDFTTREARLRTCRREVELNQRLARDVYLGVADVHGPDGELCDHLVVMRRMPEERRLSTLVKAGEPVDDDVRALARMLAALHAAAPRSPEISAEGTRDALRGRWIDSFEQVRALRDRPIDDQAVDEIERLTLSFLAGREPLFDSRINADRIVDGHGDLLAGDVFCLDDGPRALDCIEFDDRLRYLDGLDDAAFLAMDLERLGASGLAGNFLDWYAEFAADPAPPALRHHYVAYRGFVRAKVASLRHDQGDRTAAPEATGLAELTLRHLRAGAVSLILVGGLPGTGKSTLAGSLADRLGFVVLSSDRVRKELAGLDPRRPASADYREGIYQPEWTDRTYQELLARAEQLLIRGESVIIDASWSRATHRDQAARTAQAAHCDLAALRCDLPAETAAQRLRSRDAGISDADESVAAAMRARADPWPEATGIDTTGRPEDTLRRALAAARPHAHWRPRRPLIPPD